MSLRHYWVGFYTILRKETLRFMRLWIQTLVPPVITTCLYFLIFGHLIGSQLANINGFSYMQFIAPGLIMMNVITHAYANVVSSFFGAIFQKHIEELLVSPLPNSLILIGYIAGGIGRGLVVGLLITLLALCFTHLQVHSIGMSLAVFLLSASLFSLAGFTNALFAKKFDDISIIPTFVITPLTYLGGIFYSIDNLSPFWHRVSLANPILYMVNAFRYGILGISDIRIQTALSILISLTASLFILNLYLMKKGVGIRT